MISIVNLLNPAGWGMHLSAAGDVRRYARRDLKYSKIKEA